MNPRAGRCCPTPIHAPGRSTWTSRSETTADLVASGLLEGALREWNLATAARLARLVAREPGRRAGNVAAASIAGAEAAAAARATVSGVAAGLVGQVQDVT